MRAGTESLPLIAAFAEAAKIASDGMPDNIERMNGLKTYISEKLSESIPELVVIEAGAPHILSISLPGYRSEVLMNFLERRGVYVSKSSACKKGGRSHVLEAVGMSSREIDGAIRIGLSRLTSMDDADALVSGLVEAHDSLAHR